MVMVYKLIAVLLSYGVLWDALSRWRVRGPERRLQLKVYGSITALYVLLVAVTGGASPEVLHSALSPSAAQLHHHFIQAFFGVFACTFLLLGAVEVGVSVGFQDPSMPLLSRWWVRALFEGPVWRMLARRRAGMPLTPEEAESSLRHSVSGLLAIGGAIWGLQITVGALEWGRLDPVAALLLLRALNTWLDARLRSRQGAPEVSSAARLGCSIQGEPACRNVGEPAWRG